MSTRRHGFTNHSVCSNKENRLKYKLNRYLPADLDKFIINVRFKTDE